MPSQAEPEQPGKVRVNHLAKIKQSGGRIAALTAYDFRTAQLLDQAGIDMILVGDSLANVVLGYPTTLPVTMDEMLHHARAVARGVARALTVADMPFLSYQAGMDDAVRNAGRFLKEGGVEAVKVEGAGPVLAVVERLVEVGIPVLGHLGYTPQSVHRFGSNIVQAKTAARAGELLNDAIALEGAGAFGVVLECVPAEVARLITQRLTVPTIGIGAGPFCDGQILVLHDALGLTPWSPRLAKRYLELGGMIADAAASYIREVREGAFPAAEHCYEMPEDELRALAVDEESGERKGC
ncbi:MAG TPA: 3-methyl-2-oxobutanoate hydroxymethyltransferase [Bryobacteraceae bacterium]